MWKLTQSYNWNDIEQEFNWIKDMKNIPQDSIYHAEGNVAIHTRMVVEELQQLTEFEQLNIQDQHILIAAALMHDIEKHSTTKIEPDGRITSAGHAKKGEHTVREILYKNTETPFKIRETIAKLVRYHGLPLWIFEKLNPEKVLIRTSLEVNTQLLAILAMADVKGRISDEKAELLEKVDFFKEYCIELNCWNKARSFDTELAKYHYFNHDSYIDYIPFEKDGFEVVMMSALPGTGKDWYINKNLAEWPIISLDELRRKYKASPSDPKMTGRIVQEAKETARKFLRKKESFVWNATNLSSSMRKSLIDLFEEYGARIRIIYLEVPYKKLVKQNMDRKFPLPQKVLDKMISKWEVPQCWEAHLVEHIIDSQ